MRLRTSALLAAILLLSPPRGLAAQDDDTAGVRDTVFRGSRPGWSLRRTMRGFLHDFGISPVGYFPARGTWEYVTERRHPGGAAVVGVQRFSAAHTRDAIEQPDGPLCDMFSAGEGAVVPSVVAYAYENAGWRRVGPTRFQPREADDEMGVWIEWRREDSRWVISSLGTWNTLPPQLVGTPVDEARDTLRGRRLSLPLPPTARLAPEAAWYQPGGMLRIAGPPYLRQERLRTMAPGSLVYYTTVDGVTVWAEPADLHSSWGPTVAYVPVDRTGTFREFVSWRGNGCD